MSLIEAVDTVVELARSLRRPAPPEVVMVLAGSMVDDDAEISEAFRRCVGAGLIVVRDGLVQPGERTEPLN